MAALLLAGAFIGSWVLFDRNTSVSSAQTAIPPQPTNSLCYQVTEGDDPAAVVRLHTDNFGRDLVRVRQLVLMCESATKLPPRTTPNQPPPHPPEQLLISACYRMDGGDNPNEPYILDTKNFGPDDIVVGRAVLMCEQTTKTRIPATGQLPDTAPPPDPFISICYITEKGHTINRPFRMVTKNFGPDDLVVGRAVLMCETASKTRPTVPGQVSITGRPTAEVSECYTVLRGDDPQARMLLHTRNFGRDQVTVRQAVFMCEEAKKIPVYNPPPTGFDPGPALPVDPTLTTAPN
jgi:hypothetical protein